MEGTTGSQKIGHNTYPPNTQKYSIVTEGIVTNRVFESKTVIPAGVSLVCHLCVQQQTNGQKKIRQKKFLGLEGRVKPVRGYDEVIKKMIL